VSDSGPLVRVGAVDCGTNSIRLLVADVDRTTGALTDVLRRMEIVRLGYGVDRTGRIDPQAMERTLAMSHEYAGQCASLGAVAVRFAATSASRDAANAGEFVEGVREAFGAFGTTPEVITGDEEAALSFRGATGDVVAAGIDGPYLVVDLGGGSTEFVRGTGSVEAARSVDIGCVRMTERHLHSDPPTAEEVAAATADVEAAVEAALETVRVDGVRTLVGLAGTVTTVTAQAWAMPTYDAHRIHLAVTPAAQMRAAARELLAMTRAQRAARPFMHPGRVDVIGAGALVWDVVIREVAERSGRGDELTVVSSEHDILDGLALSLVPTA
jgi:exopolyphosphatase / guanosine-5'-triphosphate,3'-diphosphate pyrophosphatase